MNTLFSYFYRDACNYKIYNEVVIAGVFDLAVITPFLHDDTFFVPSEIGLLDLQENPFTKDDHIWHEIESVKPTEKTPTCKISAKEFCAVFKNASLNGWNEDSVFVKKGLL